MKIILLLLLLHNTFVSNSQDKFEWSDSRKLTMADFKGPAPDPSTHQSLVLNLGIEANLNKSDIENLKTFNNQIAFFFLRTNSWIDSANYSKLKYANTLFDLSEWKVRELRKQLNQNKELVLQGEYQKIQDKVHDEFAKLVTDYENESNYGNYIEGQMKWEMRIHEEIALLSNYCKSCQP